MNFSINMQKLLYSYWDTEGKGMNLTYLTTYSDKLIFDSYNRSFFAEGKAFGNHFIGSYHGEVFNDFEHNTAYANYSSVHGHHNTVKNESEAAFGKYNNSIKNKTIFSVGYGSELKRSNVFELQNTGVAYFKTDICSNGVSFNDTYTYLKDSYSYSLNAYSYTLEYACAIDKKYKNAYSYLASAYSYTLGYVNKLANKYDNAYSYLASAYAYTLIYVDKVDVKYDNAYSYLSNAYAYLSNAYSYTLKYAYAIDKKYNNDYSYLESAYAYTLGYVNKLANKYDNAYSYLASAYAYIYKNYPSVIPNNNYSKLYIWTGTSAELPAIENRFKNVIYIVTNERETELPEYKG